MSDWQLIETAPRDGTPILLYLNPPLDTNDAATWVPAGELTIVVGWSDDHYLRGAVWYCGIGDEHTADSYGGTVCINIALSPTHWMPLPEPPDAKLAPAGEAG